MTPEHQPERMSRAEVAGLLALVASYGPAEVGEAAVSAWREALAGYSLGECTAAVIAHAQTSPHRISPADLVGRIRAARRAKLDQAVVRDLATRPRSTRTQDAARRGMAAVYATMRWQRADRDAGLTVPCPVESCRAPVGARCRRIGRTGRDRAESRDLLTGSHPSRAELAAHATDTTATADTAAGRARSVANIQETQA
ncbi:zinc finger domain-containing protein [Actinosynnema sp. CA-248983]